MTRANVKAIGIAAVLSALTPLPAFAADAMAPVEGSDWTFTAAAYLWGSGISGKSGVFGLPPQEVDLGFGDILGDLDFAFMGLAEARKERFVLGADLTYTNVGSTVKNPRKAETLLINKVDVDTTSWMVTGFGGYTVVDTDVVRLDAIAGGRLWSVNSEFTLKSEFPVIDGRSKSDGATWVDPLIGAKARIDVATDIYISAWAMIGGFGVGSDLMWDVMAGAGYDFTEHLSVFAGYRAASVDYSDDGFVYDMVQQGPALAAVLRF
jgi:opacity protein-like surface antigen